MATITITIPDSPKEREEVLIYLEAKGLVNRNDLPEDAGKIEKKRSKWAAFAEKMHRESPLDGESEQFTQLTRRFRENFSFRS